MVTKSIYAKAQDLFVLSFRVYRGYELPSSPASKSSWKIASVSLERDIKLGQSDKIKNRKDKLMWKKFAFLNWAFSEEVVSGTCVANINSPTT